MARDIKDLKRALEDLAENLNNSTHYCEYFDSLRKFCDTLRYGKLAQAYYGAIAICDVFDEAYREDYYCMREIAYTMLPILLAKVENTFGRDASMRVKETITGAW